MVIDMNYWNKVFKRILILAISVLAVYLGFKLAIFYVPFLIAFVIAIALEPAIKWIMKKTKLKRKASSIMVFIVAFAILTGLIAWGVTALISEATNLMGNLNVYIEKGTIIVQNIIAQIDFQKLQISSDMMQTIQSSALEILGAVSTWLKGALTSILNGITAIPTIFIYIGITFLALYFMCTDRIYMLDQIEHHLPADWVKKIGHHVRDLSKTLGGYLKAQLILIVISFMISLVGLYIFHFAGLNVAYPLLVALAIGFVDALPIFGSGTVMLPWAVISACTGDLALGIAIFALWIIMSVVRQLIEPKIVSGQIGIHPIFTLIAMYTGFKFMGVIGMLVGPIILIILKNIYSTIIDEGVMKAIFDK